MGYNDNTRYYVRKVFFKLFDVLIAHEAAIASHTLANTFKVNYCMIVLLVHSSTVLWATISHFTPLLTQV